MKEKKRASVNLDAEGVVGRFPERYSRPAAGAGKWDERETQSIY